MSCDIVSPLRRSQRRTVASIDPVTTWAECEREEPTGEADPNQKWHCYDAGTNTLPVPIKTLTKFSWAKLNNNNNKITPQQDLPTLFPPSLTTCKAKGHNQSKGPQPNRPPTTRGARSPGDRRPGRRRTSRCSCGRPARAPPCATACPTPAPPSHCRSAGCIKRGRG